MTQVCYSFISLKSVIVHSNTTEKGKCSPPNGDDGNKMDITFIGLCDMGFPMAKCWHSTTNNLFKAGLKVPKPRPTQFGLHLGDACQKQR